MISIKDESKVDMPKYSVFSDPTHTIEDLRPNHTYSVSIRANSLQTSVVSWVGVSNEVYFKTLAE